MDDITNEKERQYVLRQMGAYKHVVMPIEYRVIRRPRQSGAGRILILLFWGIQLFVVGAIATSTVVRLIAIKSFEQAGGEVVTRGVMFVEIGIILTVLITMRLISTGNFLA